MSLSLYRGVFMVTDRRRLRASVSHAFTKGDTAGCFVWLPVARKCLLDLDRMEDHSGPLLDLSHAGPDIITMVLGSMPLRDRCICALACKA